MSTLKIEHIANIANSGPDISIDTSGHLNIVNGSLQMGGTTMLDTSDTTLKNVSKIGIGTASPQSMLHVETSASDFVRLTSATGNNDVGIDFFKSTTRMWNIRNNGNNDYLYITPASINDSDAVLAINPNGNVGIGTINPGSVLHINMGTDKNIQFSGGIG